MSITSTVSRQRDARQIRATLSTRGYAQGQGFMSIEGPYSHDSADSIHTARQRLTEYAKEHFIRTVRRLYGIRLSPGDVKIGYEREEPALAPSRLVHVDLFEMIYRGKQHFARNLASENLRIFRYDPEPYENEVDETYADEDDKGGDVEGDNGDDEDNSDEKVQGDSEPNDANDANDSDEEDEDTTYEDDEDTENDEDDDDNDGRDDEVDDEEENEDDEDYDEDDEDDDDNEEAEDGDADDEDEGEG